MGCYKGLCFRSMTTNIFSNTWKGSLTQPYSCICEGFCFKSKNPLNFSNPPDCCDKPLQGEFSFVVICVEGSVPGKFKQRGPWARQIFVAAEKRLHGLTQTPFLKETPTENLSRRSRNSRGFPGVTDSHPASWSGWRVWATTV